MSTEPPQRKKVTRSPGYPAMSLKEALEKAQILWDKEKRHPAPLAAIETHFGFKIGGGSISRVIAALGKFGLVEDEGQGDTKHYKLSDAALLILHSTTDSAERADAIKTAALLPAIHREIWDLYGGDLPSDETLRSYLILKRGFNPSFVNDFINNFRDTLSFGGLLGDAAAPKIGITDARSPAITQTNKRDPETKIVTPQFQAGAQTVGQIAASPAASELPIPLDGGQVARVPFPMTEDTFELLIGTLQLWKKKLVRVVEVPPTREVADDYLTQHGTPYVPSKE